MEKKILITLVAFVLTFANVSGTQQLRSYHRVPICKQPGFICDDCYTSYFCIPTEDGFLIEKIEDCAVGTTCMASTGRCTSEHNPDCVPYEFICHQAGMYPAPYKCNVYYMCCEGDAVASEHRCASGYKYNPLNALCNEKINNKCDPVVPQCMSPGQMGAVLGHPSMYYICLSGSDGELQPQMFVCPNDTVWLSNKCVSK